MKFFLRHFDSLDNAEKFAAMGDPNPLAVFDAENRKWKIIDHNLPAPALQGQLRRRANGH